MGVRASGKRLRIWLAADVSGSMAGQPLSEVNMVLAEFFSQARSICERSQCEIEIGLIQFDEQAQVMMPMTDVCMAELPVLRIRQGTGGSGSRYEAMCETLLAQLRRRGGGQDSRTQCWVCLITDGILAGSSDISFSEYVDRIAACTAARFLVCTGDPVEYLMMEEDRIHEFHGAGRRYVLPLDRFSGSMEGMLMNWAQEHMAADDSVFELGSRFD